MKDNLVTTVFWAVSSVRSARAMGREGGPKGFPQSVKRFGGAMPPEGGRCGSYGQHER